jgi:hypothetical protein
MTAAGPTALGLSLDLIARNGGGGQHSLKVLVPIAIPVTVEFILVGCPELDDEATGYASRI